MKTIIPAILALLIIHVVFGIENICHPATLGDDAWSKSECCCFQNCDDRENWILYNGNNDEFAESCPKAIKCECTERIIGPRIGGGGEGDVVTWDAGEAGAGMGFPNLGFGK